MGEKLMKTTAPLSVKKKIMNKNDRWTLIVWVLILVAEMQGYVGFELLIGIMLGFLLTVDLERKKD